MMYTCAYWSEGTKTLEEAQRNKMDHVCRKVRLARGETFVDVGSGWGGLLFHAWEHYGALGTGINPTTEQVVETRAEIARRGLDDRIRVFECDFRAMPGQYDKLLSIGTLEHAGRDQLPEVIRAHADALKPGGLGVIHFIGHVGRRDTEFFIRNYIFPGGWIPSLAQAIDWMERCGLEVMDVENLRRHYALTLDCWAERFDRSWDAIHALDPRRFDERFRRIWRAYLWSCAEVFRAQTPDLNLFQVTVSKGNVREQLPNGPRVPVPATMTAHAERRAQLVATLAGAVAGGGRPAIGLAKSTSNLFRDRARRPRPAVDLSGFDQVVRIDREARVVEAEGMIPYVALTDATLAHGLVPAVVPQLKSITLGGAVAGVGIEASAFRHGLVHDTVTALEILTGDRRIVTATRRQRSS